MKRSEGVRAIVATTAADDDIIWTEDEEEEEDAGFDSFGEDDLVLHSTPVHLATPKVLGASSGDTKQSRLP